MKSEDYRIEDGGPRELEDPMQRMEALAEQIKEMARSIGLDEEQIAFLADANIPLAERLGMFLPGGDSIAAAVEAEVLKATGKTYDELTGRKKGTEADQ